LDLARKFARGRLLLADDYWEGGSHAAHGAYPWAWELLQPLSLTSASSWPPAPHMRTVTDPVSFENVLDNWTCNTRFSHVALARRSGCFDHLEGRPQYCHLLLPGAVDRGASLLPGSVMHEISRAGPVNALWHFRTGDVTVPLLNASFQRVKRSLDAGLPHRTVVHRALTERGAGALQRLFPFLRESGVRSVPQHSINGTYATLSLMRRAHVLISTGSSFSLAAAALAPVVAASGGEPPFRARSTARASQQQVCARDTRDSSSG